MQPVITCRSIWIWKVSLSLTNFLSIDWMLDISVRCCDLWPKDYWHFHCNVWCSFPHQALDLAAKLSFVAPPGLEEVRFYFWLSDHWNLDRIWNNWVLWQCMFRLVVAVALTAILKCAPALWKSHNPSFKCMDLCYYSSCYSFMNVLHYISRFFITSLCLICKHFLFLLM